MTSSRFVNKEIAELLRSIAAAYELKNENRFRIIAYDKAADTVEHMTRELHDIWQEGGLAGLQKVQGIGPTISSHLDELFSKGESKHFATVMKDIPASVFVLMRVPGIGPKRAFKLVKELGFVNPDRVLRDVVHAAKLGKIATLETFGEKSQSEILKSITLHQTSAGKSERMPLPYAHALAEEVEEHLRKVPGVKRIDFLGSLRRRVATIGDIDVAVGVEDKKQIEAVIDHFTKFKRAIRVDNKGERKSSIIVSPNIRIDLRVQDLETYGSMLQYFTGSKNHNIKLREFALKKKLSLNEYGIKDLKIQNSKLNIHEFRDEESFYKFLGLPYIDPEIREGTDEIQRALKGTLPHLVQRKDIKGDLHIHSSYNASTSHDLGANTVEEIVQKAKSLGYEYVGFSDHNPSTSNNTEKEIVELLKKRKQHIDTSLKHIKFPYFIGLEVDIDPNGKLAIPEEATEYLDYVIVSVHSAFRQEKVEATRRVMKALSSPKVKIFGHPTGRMLGRRDGLEYDWDEIFAYVKAHHIAIEVNSGPERLDLPETLVRVAVDQGVKLIVDTDAHHVDWMDGMEYGISVARRGWAQKGDIMNTRNLKDFKEWLLD